MTGPAERRSAAPSTASRTPFLVVAAAGGAGTMVVELAAVRLISPWFGTSLVVWTNVIGVVLLSLSVGYLIGARLAARPRPESALIWVLAIAAAAAAWTPSLSAPVCDVFMPRSVPLHEALGLLHWGSLAASLVLFLPPALALGCVAPVCVEICQRRAGGHAGASGGAVLAASTLGSLAGTFGTSLWLIPSLGVSATFTAGAELLGLSAFLAWIVGRERRDHLALAPLLVAVPGFLWAELVAPDVGAERELLASVDSPYQTVRVVADGRTDPPLRILQVNELSDSYQSVWQSEVGLLPEGYYYNAFALPPHWSGARDGAWRVLVLGLGAGTTWRVLEGTLPAGLTLETVGVELDPAVVALSVEHMDLVEGRDRKIVDGVDARAFLALDADGRAFDQIVLDTYANQIEIPAHLSTLEFLRKCVDRLTPGGWLALNVGSFGFDDPVLVALASTLATAFESRVLAIRIPKTRNHVLFARRDAPLPEPGSVDWRIEGPLADWLAPLELPGSYAWFVAGDGPTLTDDHNPIDLLQARSLRSASGGGGP